MIDNFEQIKELLEFPNDNSFYFVQILQRKKDNPGTVLGGSNNNSRLIKAYYVRSKEQLDIYKEEMIKLADLFNARVGINLNPRNFEKVAFRLLQKVADQMSNKDFYNIKKAYDSACGLYSSEIDKRWLVDIDEDDNKTVNFVANYIKQLQQKSYYPEVNIDNSGPRKVLAVIKTKNGWHIITQPFNIAGFRARFPTIEVHKNNPTLLYCP